eukprot:3802242-Prymnesium_polylepis.1
MLNGTTSQSSPAHPVGVVARPHRVEQNPVRVTYGFRAGPRLSWRTWRTVGSRTGVPSRGRTPACPTL